MKRYRLLIEGTESVHTNLNKSIILVKNDVLIEVEDKGDVVLVKFENDSNFRIPLGHFEISKSKLVEI